MDKTFGEILKQIMKEKGLTQAELAEKLDVSQVAVSKLIRNVSSPTIDRSLTILEQLDYTIAIVPRRTEPEEKSFLIAKSKED